MLSRFLFLVFFVYSASGGAAPFITKCKSDDTKCMKVSAQNAIPVVAAGIPELGVKQLDPLRIKYLDASSKGLKLVLNDVVGTGLKGCVVKKIQRDVEKSKLFVKLQCTVDFVADYEMTGQLLILPIEGKGKAHVVLRKITIAAEVDMADSIGKDGEKHWNIKSWTHSYDVKEKSTIELENLFNGNELLGRAARELIATSSNEIVREVGPPIVKAVVAEIIENVKNLFHNVPADELAQD
ncbi:circadian clock-controlled protein daywake-like [Anticarsia gemmatalis]|uniref:circadian clock-controlled protein daywake-like n=1 Tax=Anticarsia gemmatalis TaxID=129554 RepID=UPI003F770CFA